VPARWFRLPRLTFAAGPPTPLNKGDRAPVHYRTYSGLALKCAIGDRRSMESTTPTGSDSNEVLVARASEFLSAVGWLADAGLLGAFVIGSVGAGMADELSDVDLAVVFDDIPSPAARRVAYRSAGCTAIELEFFSAHAPALASNVEAVDKLRFHDTPVDLSLCMRAQFEVYRLQAVVPLIPSNLGQDWAGATSTSSIAPHRVAARIKYDLRIAVVHTHRYQRLAARRDWMAIDTGLWFAAVRDVLVVLSGTWEYNPHDRRLWTRVADAGLLSADFERSILDVKHLDDRTESRVKVKQMEGVVAGLRALCESQGWT